MSIQPVKEFFGNSDLTNSATYTPAGGQPSAINVIWELSDYTIPGINSIGVEDADIRISCKTSDVPNAKPGDTFLINGVTYYSILVSPDIYGITKITLSVSL